MPLPDISDGRPPAVDFLYDLSPIVVTLNMRPPSFLHYLVRMAAVVGGVFAITRMVDRHVDWMVSKAAPRPRSQPGYL
jgi:hypothetical protein